MKCFIKHKLTTLLFMALFACCFITLSGCDELVNKAKQLIPNAGSQYSASDEMKRAQGEDVKQRPAPQNNNTTQYGNYTVKWELANNTIKWSAYDGNSKKAEGTINFSDNPDKHTSLVSNVSGTNTVNVSELIKEVQKIIPDAGSQYNAAEELRWAQGKSDKIKPYAPKGVNTPNKVPKDCYYSFSWNSPNATQCCVNWSFYDKNGKKMVLGKDSTSGWINKSEWGWKVPKEEGIMYVNVYAKNSGGQSQEPLAFEVKVIEVDDKGIEYLSYDDYLSVFSNPVTYNKKFAYWCMKASSDAYKSVNNTMDTMGFPNTPIVPLKSLNWIDLQAFIGVKKLDKTINNTKTVVMISVRGTKNIGNILSDIFAYPVKWSDGIPNLKETFTIEFFDKTPEVHAGFYYCTKLILNKMQENKDYKAQDLKNTLFIVTGHSLGGAIAELISLNLKENGVPTKNIICYGFASPPVGDTDLYDFANGKYGGKQGELSKQIHKVMNTGDKIPIAGIFAYTLALSPYKFTHKNPIINIIEEQAGHEKDLVYLNHTLSLLEKVYCK
ncbi:MAG: lipase family protein [Prevotellaceae bacterium]|nr:lipase family protein [Prevotellaceae bacterium]